MMKTNDRIAWIDMAKGFGILAVIYAHLAQNPVSTWLYTFHVPLFFFLSGYVFSAKKPPLAFCKAKCRSVLVPYFALGIPLVLYRCLTGYLQKGWTAADVIWKIKSFLLQKRFDTLWYLACLFCLYFLFYALIRLLRRPIPLAAASVLLAVGGLVYYRLGFGPLYWNVDAALTAAPFFAAGYLCKEYRETIESLLSRRKIALPLFFGCGAVNLLGCFLSDHFCGNTLDMFACRYPLPPLAYLTAFAGIGFVSIAAHWITLRPICLLGENSLLYFLWHQSILMPVTAQLMHFLLPPPTEQLRAVYQIVQLLLIIALITPVHILLDKTRLRVLLGKKTQPKKTA